jgi:two-component system phosphate regulon sensor histidine kinase PhoR
VPKHFSLKVFFPQERSYILESLWAMLASSGIFIAAIIGTFVFTLNSLWNQKRLSDMKTDFINNMTHEFQTPIATISLAAEALKGGTSVGEEKRARFLDIIFNENKRLGKHVEQILHAAAYDDGRFTVHSTEVNINHTVMMAVQNIAMQIENRGGNIFCKFDVTQPVIRADHEHLANIIRNLLDNACKYSPDSPDITVTTQSNEKGVVITVADKGIGMTKEQQKRIFEKFYRVPTGNRHDVKGFGLGLSYVKTMAEAHGGSVSVESNAGSGSKFGIFLPYSI